MQLLPRIPPCTGFWPFAPVGGLSCRTAAFPSTSSHTHRARTQTTPKFDVCFSTSRVRRANTGGRAVAFCSFAGCPTSRSSGFRGAWTSMTEVPRSRVHKGLVPLRISPENSNWQERCTTGGLFLLIAWFACRVRASAHASGRVGRHILCTILNFISLERSASL